MSNHPHYRGRFAPSPTGALHFGSLVAAVASYADALHHQGQWLVRMEDVDETRVIPGSADDILCTLEAFGFEWASPVVFQSQRKSRYRDALRTLQQQNLTYICDCSRRQIAKQAIAGIEGFVYPGNCRKNRGALVAGKATRLLTRPDDEICFFDRIAGKQCQVLTRDVGDFIIHRADGYSAYQLAVVVDDADQGITHIVRGADLLLSTPRQLYLQQLLDFPEPSYAHVPLVTDTQGRKLSKQDQDRPVTSKTPLAGLVAAWQFLRQAPPPKDIIHVAEFWTWAATHWDIQRIGLKKPMEGLFQ